MNLLAKADLVDHSGDLPLMLGCIFILIGAAALAFFPIRSARVRNHRHAEAIMALALLWALLAAGSAVYFLFAQSNFASEHQQLMTNGFLDYDDRAAAPAVPWLLWSGLLVAYVIVLVASMRGPKVEPEEPPPQDAL